MLAKIYSAAVYGVDAYEVEIEVNGAGGDPVIVIVGLPDAAVKESRDRVTTAISNSGYYWPRGRTTINLAPADSKKRAAGRPRGATPRQTRVVRAGGKCARSRDGRQNRRIRRAEFAADVRFF